MRQVETRKSFSSKNIIYFEENRFCLYRHGTRVNVFILNHEKYFSKNPNLAAQIYSNTLLLKTKKKDKTKPNKKKFKQKDIIKTCLPVR